MPKTPEDVYAVHISKSDAALIRLALEDFIAFYDSDWRCARMQKLIDWLDTLRPVKRVSDGG